MDDNAGETKERAVCDYIAGMTDIYAIDRFKESVCAPRSMEAYKEAENLMYYPEEVIEEVRMQKRHRGCRFPDM